MCGEKNGVGNIRKGYFHIHQQSFQHCVELQLLRNTTVINSDNVSVINSDNVSVINSDNVSVINSDNVSVINFDNVSVVNSDNHTYK